MNKPAIHYQSIRDGGKMFLCCIFLKQGIQPCIGGSNLCVPVLISKKRWPVGLRHRTQKNNIEKQRRNYFTDVRIGFRFLAHAVKIRISGFKSFIQDFAEFDEHPSGNRIQSRVKQQIIEIFILAVNVVHYGETLRRKSYAESLAGAEARPGLPGKREAVILYCASQTFQAKRNLDGQKVKLVC